MKPVFAHTMGQGHKTLDASSFLANPSAWRSLSVKVCIFHQSRVSLVYASRWMTKEVQLSANDKVHRCHHVRSPGVTCCSPWPWFPAGVKSVQARHRASAPLSATSLPDHANLLWWLIKGPESCAQRAAPRESSDPHWL